MKRLIRSSQYIPDLTERFPEGFGGRDMYDVSTPEEAFWDAVDRAEQSEREDKQTYWVSFATQDGVQKMTYIEVPTMYSPYEYIESVLIDEYGDDLAEIADYDLAEDDE